MRTFFETINQYPVEALAVALFTFYCLEVIFKRNKTN